MSKGIFTAVSGAMAQSARMDTIANNLANVNTPAFKKDSQLFREYLASFEKEPGTITVPRVPASIESFHDMQGGDKSYVDLNGTYTDFAQGTLRSTGNSLDLALEGNGFIEVSTANGPRLTRNGSFSLDGEGRLVTKQGDLVLSEGAFGENVNERVIRISSPNVTVTSNGDIVENGAIVGRLSLVQATPPDALEKIGQSLYTLRSNFVPELQPATNVKVHQGFLEGSNVNMIKEMTEMIGATRVFESTQKAIQAYDLMAGKVVNDVPKLR